MLQQLQQASVASALQASNVRVVDPAKPTNRPYKPDPPKSAGIGLICGLCAGVILTVVRERADRTIQQPGDATFYTNLPELGIIPSASDMQRRRITLKRAPEGNGPTPARDGEARVELVTGSASLPWSPRRFAHAGLHSVSRRERAPGQESLSFRAPTPPRESQRWF